MKKIKLYRDHVLRMSLIGTFMLGVTACSSSSGSATNGGDGQNNGDASSLQVIAPKIVYSKSSTDSTGYVLIKNPTESAVSNLHYSLTQAVGSGSAVTLEPSSATNCASVAAHSQCSIKLLVSTGSVAGSIGFSAENKSSQNKQTQAATGTVSSIGIEQAAYNNSISGADGITLSYYHTIIAGLPYIMVSGLVASSKAGSFNNIVLTDNNANPLPNQELISGSISSAQGSTFNILLPVPSLSGASQIIRVQTQQVASDGSVTVVSTSNNSSTLSTSTKIGIADMLPSVVYLTSTHPEQVVTFANTGDVNAELQALVASSSNIEVSFNPTTIGSGTTTTATLKLKNTAVPAGGGSITLSYNNGQEEVKNSAAVGENVNLAPSPTPTPTPSPKPVPAVSGLSTSLSPDSNFFTTTAIGTVSRTMTIHNSGNTPETNFVFTLPNNDFSIASSGSTASDCTVDAPNKTVTNSLSSGGECNLTVIYTKNTAVTESAGSISIAYNYSGSTPAPVPATQSVNYKVTQSRAILNLSPTSVTYTNIVNNSQDSSTAILTLTNTGDLPATNLSRTINPNPSSLFTITGASTNCGTGNTLPIGESCTITTQFGPTAAPAGINHGVLTISDGGGLATATSTLIGTVLSAQFANISQGAFSGANFAGGTGAVSPNQFQIERSSTTYPSVSITLTNSGSVPATNFYIGEISPNSNWTLGGNCGTSVSKVFLAASGGSCTATFTMTAAAVTNSGAQNLVLTNYRLMWNDQARPVTPAMQALTGTVYVNVYAPASIAVTTSPASNISITRGESFTMTATLSGGYAVTAQTIHATTTNADISFINNDCALNSQGGYTCTISAVAANDAAVASNQTVTLSNTTTPSMAPSPGTITFAIPTVKYVYITNYSGNSYTQCRVSGANGALSGCNTVIPAAPGALNNPTVITINNGYAYIVNYSGNSYTQCTVSGTGGTLSGCNTVVPAAPSALNVPSGITINNGYAYIASFRGNSYTQCTVSNADGTLSGCNTVVPAAPGALNAPISITINNGYAYITNSGGNSYTQCAVSGVDGTLSGCNAVVPAVPGVLNKPYGITINNGYAYIVNYGSNSYTKCTVSGTDGTLSGCNTVVPAAPGTLNAPSGITINNGYAYIVNSRGNSYTQCTVSGTDGTLLGCNTVIPAAPGALNVPFGIMIN